MAAGEVGAAALAGWVVPTRAGGTYGLAGLRAILFVG
jgi:hypothetical protein